MTVNDVRVKITPILEEYGISYAGVFGSVAKGESKDNSDVDIIVRFGRPMGMFIYMKFVNSLEDSLQRRVDVVTENSLNKFIKPYVLPDIKVIYEN